MMIALTIMVFMWCVPAILYIIWKRGDWYLFLFPLFISILICRLLATISYVLSIVFSIMVVGYSIYNFTNKKAMQISNEIRKEREKKYAEYKKEDVDNQVTFKDYLLPSGNKVEYIDFNTKTFYILRPYAENINKKYDREIQKYLKELTDEYGEEWSCVIDTY